MSAAITLTFADLVRLRAGDVRRVAADDGSPVLVLADTSPARPKLTWPDRIVLTLAELDLIERHPGEPLIANVEGSTSRGFALIGEAP
ncbi:hypothetical protein Ade02nite_20440 [Paractinoplanes deccanensis]|uniref:Uncharacterized protein n=1 Tax=Paractinoplanes deccanensis TaxID=113561 RepID=A0ABQ3Y075_9ACTN|nr:hypothetical protein [Actinoplanes deccanensis]GID73403.1 hypothetical protein Ade02nite_20440 [Actinoplanes deccanensis]